MKQVEYEVKIDKDATLRCRNVEMAASEILGFSDIINRENIEKATYMYQQIMEHIEVEIAGAWVPLKEKGREEYNPAYLADRPAKLMQISTLFLTKVLFPVFLESKESNN